MTAPIHVDLRLPRDELSRFKDLLQRGVALHADGGQSAHAFLVEGLGVPADYVKERITTVFLDGQVVDDLEDAVLRDGSLLALSAAMPGLVGATLRKSGYYAAMRAAITHAAERGDRSASGGGTVRVKLFNLLLEELGPVLLSHGVLLERREASEVLGRELPPGDGAVELRVDFQA